MRLFLITFRFRQFNFQNTVFIMRFDGIGFDIFRQHKRATKRIVTVLAAGVFFSTQAAA